LALLSNTLISILAYTAEPKARQAGAGALAQVSQRGYGVSLLGDFQKLPGHGPGRAALRVPAGAGAGVDKPRGAFPLQPVCDSAPLSLCVCKATVPSDVWP